MAPAWAIAADGPRVYIPFAPPSTRPSDADFEAIIRTRAEANSARRNAAATRAELGRARAKLKRFAVALWSELSTNGELVDATNRVVAARAS